MIIYKATNLINSKIYIGLTTKSLEQRKYKHIRDAFNNDSIFAFHKALRKYKQNNFIWEVIDTAKTQDELNEKEIHWIEFYNSFGVNGYNLTRGGEGRSGYSLSVETRKKISEAHQGSKHHNAKLTEKEVLKIKELLKVGETQTNIAKKFNVNRETISLIKSGKLWSHTGEDISSIECSKTSNAKLTEDDVREIKNLLKGKTMTHQEIANRYNVNKSTINNIKRNKAWTQVGEDVSIVEYSKKGTSNSQAKLTDSDVREIKTLLKEGIAKQKEIAEMYGVGVTTVSQIKLGNRWTHIVVA